MFGHLRGRAWLLVIAPFSDVYEILCLLGAEDDLGKVQYHMVGILFGTVGTPHSVRE